MSMYHDGRYLESNPGWHAEHSGWKADHIASILAANGVKPDTVAEVGCGAGQILVELEKRLPDASQFVGFEISPQAFPIANKKAGGKRSYVNEDVISNPPAVPFDLVMAIDVFEHVDDYIGFIRGLGMVGKYKIFHIPLELSVSAMLRPGVLERARKDVGHIHYYTRDTALSTLEHAGLEIIEHRFTSVSIDRAEHLRTKLLRLPRKMLFALAPDFAARLFGGFSLLVLAR